MSPGNWGVFQLLKEVALGIVRVRLENVMSLKYVTFFRQLAILHKS